MKTYFMLATLFLFSSVIAQQADTVVVRKTSPVKKVDVKVDQAPQKIDFISDISGTYTISGYAVLSLNTLPKEELNALIGTDVIISNTSITGSSIDPFTFEIYQIEKIFRDDYIFRVFGREIKAPEPDMPSQFYVHKTDNENLYGIAETGEGELAIPYHGVLLYLVKK
ncbi:MAG: hypothetical protein IPM74_02270 [Crocinitomicaceae bacterium]|nr:hypothetical protein [Crocinitomicaceae bacterium]MBK8924742.1 hypothetical protein [Crocinitomicaceae bacterium]